MNDVVYIFAHIPKTGGTTIRQHFEKNLTPSEFVHLANAGEAKASKKGLPPFAERSEEERNKARVVLGHQVNSNTHKMFPNKTCKHLVFLREPISWTVSRYNWRMNVLRKDGEELPSFDQWFEDVKQRQSQIVWLLKSYGGVKNLGALPAERKLKMTNELLEKFDVVSLTERINTDCPTIFRTIGVPEEFENANVAGQRHPKVLSPTDELREKLAKPLELDIKLYEAWKAKMPVLNL